MILLCAIIVTFCAKASPLPPESPI
jgi:hypothetical protein